MQRCNDKVLIKFVKMLEIPLQTIMYNFALFTCNLTRP